MSLTIVRDLSIRVPKVDTSLEHSIGAGVTVDTNPNRDRSVTARRGGDSEGPGDHRESSLFAKEKEIGYDRGWG